MDIAVIGTGYVGLVSGICLADLGHRVMCVDIDERKIKSLREGMIPLYEPQLANLLQKNQKAGRILFTSSLASVVKKSKIIIICVGTPALPDGRANLQYLFRAAKSIGKSMNGYKVIITKSTVPVGTNQKVKSTIRKSYTRDFDIVSCPEFLREGSAVEDFFHPDRIVVGTDSPRAKKIMMELFEALPGERVFCSIPSAELIKYTSNAFLAMKISFINEVAHICERSGGDVDEVAYGVGLDKRIGQSFLKAGIGWGGSCFPKDVSALHQIAGSHGYKFHLLKSIIHVNQDQRKYFFEKIKKYYTHLRGKRFAVLGLAFKAHTDDVRESASLEIIQKILKAGAKIQAFDYRATENAKNILGQTVSYYDDPYECMQNADAILVLTEWPAFKELDWEKAKTMLKKPVIFDGRNLLSPQLMREQGFRYYSLGRP